jgi:hypothetical protein
MKRFALLMAVLLSAFAAEAHDVDLDLILKAVETTPCSEVQVLIAQNIGVVYWNRMSMRYLYDEDIAPLRNATLQSGKRTIDVDVSFEIPNLDDPDWMNVEDRLEAQLKQIFNDDYRNHPPNGC